MTDQWQKYVAPRESAPRVAASVLRSTLTPPSKGKTMALAKVLTLTVLSLTSVLAFAAEPKPFTQQAFEKLAQEGKPVVVDVSATWCPTCKAQKPIVDKLSKSAAYKDVTVLNVDFDTDKPVLKEFKVAMQSTLIAFKGGKETGRSVGDTTTDGIEGIFKKAAH